MPYFHCSSSLLSVGSIIESGNWGRIIRNFGWSHNQALKEVTFEHIRSTEFPDKPSRLQSTFFFDSEYEAVFYAKSDGREKTMVTYEVELLAPDAVQHRADWRHVNPVGNLDFEWARNYWRGVEHARHVDDVWDAACREIVAETGVRILRRV